jgi:hypothetical protein
MDITGECAHVRPLKIPYFTGKIKGLTVTGKTLLQINIVCQKSFRSYKQHIMQHIMLNTIALWRLLLFIFDSLRKCMVFHAKRKYLFEIGPEHRGFKGKHIALTIFCKFVLHAGALRNGKYDHPSRF